MSYQLNESDKWVKEPQAELIIDLSDPSLNGVKIGDNVSALSFLGKSDNVQFRESSFQYKRLGLTVATGESKVKGLNLTFKSFVERVESFGGFRSFKGSINFEGTKLSLEIEEIKKCLGEEAECWDDEVDQCFRFVRNETWIEFIFDSQSHRIKEIGIELLLTKRR